MRTKLLLLIAAAAGVLFSGHMLAAEASASNINSAYKIQGDRAIAPVQVFDDGTRTYLQLRDPRYPPAVLLEDGSVLPFTPQPPYLVLQGTYDAMVLRYGRHLATVRSRSALNRPKPDSVPSGQNVWYGVAEPGKLTGVASDPVPASSVMTQAVPAPGPMSGSGFSGMFSVERVTDIAVKASMSARSQTVEIAFPGKDIRTTVGDIVRLSDLVEQAGQGRRLVVRSGNGRLDLKRQAEVKRQLARLGVNSRHISTETVKSLSGRIEVSGDGQNE